MFLRASNIDLLYIDTAVFSTIENLGADDLSSMKVRLSRVSLVSPVCFSYTSIMELSRGDLSAQRLELADFFDRIPTKWLYAEDILEGGEVVSYVKSPLLGPFGATNPYCDSVVGCLRNARKTEEKYGLEAWKWSFSALLRHSKEFGEDSISRMFSRTTHGLGKFRNDRQSALEIPTVPQAIKARSARKRTEALESEVREYLLKNPEHMVTFSIELKPHGFFNMHEDFALKEVDLPKFPLRFLRYEFLHARGFNYANQDESKFLATANSEVTDSMHLCGAAYCKHFTCDMRTAEAIKNARKKLELPPPIVMRGVGMAAISDVLDKVEAIK